MQIADPNPRPLDLGDLERGTHESTFSLVFPHGTLGHPNITELIWNFLSLSNCFLVGLRERGSHTYTHY